MSNFIYKEKDGSLSEFTVAPEYAGQLNIGDRVKASVIAEGPVEHFQKVVEDDMPSRKLFPAWDFNSDGNVVVSIPKGKEFLHNHRRAKREKAFAPNLDIIDRASKNIPLKADESESSAKSANDSIKSDDDALQIQIDACKTEQDLLNAIGEQS